jgi:hypothetical protein
MFFGCSFIAFDELGHPEYLPVSGVSFEVDREASTPKTIHAVCLLYHPPR